MPASSFPQFPLLPTELRLRVWSLALPSARIISLFPVDHLASYQVKKQPPVLFCVNHEARSVAMEYYRPYVIFMTSPDSVGRQAECRSPAYEHKVVWLDLRRDVLFFAAEIASMPRFRIRRVDGDQQQQRGAFPSARNGMDRNRIEPARGTGGKGEDEGETDLALAEILRLAIPYDALLLRLRGWCGTGAYGAWRDHSQRVKAFRAAIDALPSLRNIYVVVDNEKDKNSAAAASSPNEPAPITPHHVRSPKDLEFVDLHCSANFAPDESDEIIKSARTAFGFPVDGDLDPATEARRSAMLPVVELRTRKGWDFTCTEAEACASVSTVRSPL